MAGLVTTIVAVQQYQDLRQKAAENDCSVDLSAEEMAVKKPEKRIALISSSSLHQSTRDITNEIRNKNFQNKESLKKQLKERKLKLLEIMQTNPSEALGAIMPKKEREQLGGQFTGNCVEKETELEGTVTLWHVDYGDDTSKLFATLERNNNQNVRVYLANGISMPLHSRDSVRMKGYLLGSSLLVNSAETNSIVNISAPVAQLTDTVGQQDTIAVIVSFINAQATVGSNVVQDLLFNRMNTYYQETSYGKTSVVGNVIGPIQLTMNESCDYPTIISNVIQAADSQVDFRQYKHLVISAPLDACYPALGLSTIGRQIRSTNDGSVSISISLINEKYSGQVLIAGHEFGHGLGLLHSGFLNCGNVTFGSSCSFNEYGDAYDLLGNHMPGHYNSAKKDILSWFDSNHIRTVTQNGTFELEPLETQTNGLKALRIPQGTDGSGRQKFLYIDYRQRVGADANFDYSDIYNGAEIHMNTAITDLNTAPGGGIDTQLVDATPPASNQTPALHVGQSVTDPVSGATITVTNLVSYISSANIGSLTVSISGLSGNGDTINPTVSITSPVDGQTLSGTTNVTASASDNVGVDRVEFYKQGENLPFGTSRSAPYSYSWDTTSLPNGPYYLFARAYDAAGNVAQTGNILVNIQNSVQVIPTVSIPPGNTGLSLTLALHGIGKGGDNVNPAGTGNTNPLHPSRQAQIQVFDAANQLLLTKNGIVTYTSTDGKFHGVFDMGTLATGDYVIRVGISQYLWNRSNIVHITIGQINTIPEVSLVTGDTNNNNSLNILDYNNISDCYSDLSPAKNCSDSLKKQMSDLTDDGNVNQYDYNLFIREISVQTGL